MSVAIIAWMWVVGAVALLGAILGETKEPNRFDWIVIAFWPVMFPIVGIASVIKSDSKRE